jgi:hypothetical protein
MARAWGKLLARIIGYGILVLLLLVALALTSTVGWRPVIGAKKRSLTSRKFEVTPQRHSHLGNLGQVIGVEGQ